MFSKNRFFIDLFIYTFLVTMGVFLVLCIVNVGYTVYRNNFLKPWQSVAIPNNVEQALQVAVLANNSLDPKTNLQLFSEPFLWSPVPLVYENSWALSLDYYPEPYESVMVSLYWGLERKDYVKIEPDWIETESGGLYYTNIGEVNLIVQKDSEGLITLTVME